MVETGEPVKLFGAMIGVVGEDEKELLIEKPTVKIKGREQEQADAEESSEPPASSSIDTEHNEVVHVDKAIVAGNSSGSEEKHLKKPTKILPCPRCHSLDTKFCYFNNYNVNQPRHFCKACQRYWTDGGAMRNMAVGAGRRKSKSSSSSCQYKQITLLEASHNNPEQPPDRTILAFRKGLLSHEYQSEKKHKSGANSINPIHETADSVMTQSASNSQPCQPSAIAVPSPWNVGSTLYTPCLPVSFYLVNTYQTPRRPGCVEVPTPIRPPVPMFSKHSRNGDMILRKNSLEEGVCSTRDLPSEDPSNAGNANAREGFRPRGFLGVFHHPKADADAVPKPSVYAALQANPSAMMRSLKFHENIMWRNDIYG